MGRMKVQGIFNDLHAPELDPAATRVALAILRDAQPDRIDMVGDLANWDTMSTKFKTVPRKARWGTLLGELAPLKRFLGNLREAFPRATMVFHEGNHEARLHRWIVGNAPQLSGVLTVPDLLGLEKLHIEHRPYGHLERCGNLRLTHGSLVRKGSGVTARAMLQQYGVPVLFGHTHRGAAIYQTTGRTTIGAWENFCLCRMEQSYTVGPQDWQHGFSVVHNDYHRRFEVVQVPIIGGRALHGGQEYAATKIKTEPVLGGV